MPMLLRPDNNILIKYNKHYGKINLEGLRARKTISLESGTLENAYKISIPASL